MISTCSQKTSDNERKKLNNGNVVQPIGRHYLVISSTSIVIRRWRCSYSRDILIVQGSPSSVASAHDNLSHISTIMGLDGAQCLSFRVIGCLGSHFLRLH